MDTMVIPFHPSSHSNNNGASNRSGTSKNAALIRRLWRSAITESRNKTAGAEQCTSSGSAAKQKQKQSLKEKLMEARMNDQKENQKQ
jgi:metal-responsive CopG/Arc/MetJ family transcriptional regulator